MLNELWQTLPQSEPQLFDVHRMSSCRVLELGAGTGVLPACLFADTRWMRPLDRVQWIATDRAENMPLLSKNVSASPFVCARELDWIDVQRAHGRALDHIRQHVLSAFASGHTETAALSYPDLIMCFDCVYNPALHRPLIDTLHAFSLPLHTAVLVVMQLRDVDNTHEFLSTWLSSSHAWRVFHLDAALLPPAMRAGFVAWLAWRVA